MKTRSNVVYGSVNGAALLADIAWPESGDSFPAILSVHGGRWIRGTRHDNGAIDVKQWAEKGFFAMSIDYRLVTCTPAPACYLDVLRAIRWIHNHAKEYSIDPENLFLIGQSAGGHMAALAATLGMGAFNPPGSSEDELSDHFKAAISVSGAYDLPRLDWGSGWCPPGQDWQSARDYASPLNHVSAQCKPILLFHSDNDHSVPIKQALDMTQALEAQKADYEFVRYSDQGHLGITDDVIQKTLRFIEIQMEENKTTLIGLRNHQQAPIVKRRYG